MYGSQGTIGHFHLPLMALCCLTGTIEQLANGSESHRYGIYINI